MDVIIRPDRAVCRSQTELLDPDELSLAPKGNPYSRETAGAPRKRAANAKELSWAEPVLVASQATSLRTCAISCSMMVRGNEPCGRPADRRGGNREPCGPYRVRVGARRTLHLRFNDLSDPEPVPRDTSYASVIESSVPIIVQHTRLDSRNPNIALLSTIAFPA